MAESSNASAWERLLPVMDLTAPMALRVAATLRLADLIAGGASQLDVLAARAGCDPDALGRMLRLLVVRGVFTEETPGVFAVNEPAALLRSDHPEGMATWLDLDGFGGRMDLAFTGLLHTVRTGEPAWEQVFGKPFWQHLDADPALAKAFDATMVTGPDYFSDAITGYDFSGVGDVIDVGGGTGMLLGVLLRAHPELRATLVELPDTVDRAKKYLGELGLAQRCSFVPGSFFDPLPTGGEVYLLRGVIHDWDDANAVAILRRCADAARAEAAGPRGRVLIVEAHGTSGNDPASFAEMNLRMLVLCGGRERGLDDFRALVERAGLRMRGHTVSSLGNVFIDCEPV